MISKKLFSLLFMLFLSACGYQSIYSDLNSQNLSINKISTSGDVSINRKILNLTKIKENKEKNLYSHNLNLISTKIKEVVAKDAFGNASVFKMMVNIDFSLTIEDQKNKGKIFTSSFIYNNSNNKFDLSQYENIVENNLIEKLAEEIMIFINL